FPPSFFTSLSQGDDTWWAAGAFPTTLAEFDRGHPTGAQIELDSVAEQLGLPSDMVLYPQSNGAWLPDRGWLCLLPSHLAVENIACVDPETSRVRATIPTGYVN